MQSSLRLEACDRLLHVECIEASAVAVLPYESEAGIQLHAYLILEVVVI